MKVVYKYEVNRLGVFSLSLHEGYEMLSVQTQGGVGCVWVLLDTSLPKVEASFQCVYTGWKAPDNIKRYIGTFQISWEVVHLFELN